MTLYRQLLIFTLSFTFILFIGVWVDKLYSTRTFLLNQLASHAQDTATSLGLSLSPFVAQGDLATTETMINAIFDRGYYRLIRLTDINNEILSQRESAVVIDSVPDWFIDKIALATPGAEALLMDGWKKAGTVYVESHPGYAYQALWRTAKTVSLYFLLTGILILTIGGVGIHFLLRPLHRVERQAEAICRREYEIQRQLPCTRELRQVVISMNKMTTKVKEMFEEQAASAERLRESVFVDVLTGLGNRRYLVAQVNAAMNEKTKPVKGGFQLIQIHDLQLINEGKGYDAGDAIIKRAAEIIGQHADSWPGAIAVRLNGGDFALLLPDIDADGNEHIAGAIATHLTQLATEQLAVSEHVCNIGVLSYTRPATLEELLAQSDAALAVARHTGPNQWRRATAATDIMPTQSYGHAWQKETLERSMAEGSLLIYTQRVTRLTNPQETLHLEIFSRIALSQEEEIHAEAFVPMAARSTLITKLDRYVTERLLSQPPATPCNLAINLAARSLLDKEFIKSILSRLASWPPGNPRIFFEFSEYRALQYRTELDDFSRLIKAAGHDLGLDHFGRSFSNFGYLKTVRPHYVKIDPVFIRELASGDKDSYFFISALKGVVHSLDIQLIAEEVETEEQYTLLQEIGIDGVGGFFIEHPQRLALSA